MGKFITRFISSLIILCCIGVSQVWANCDYTFNQDVYTTSIHNGEVIYQASFDNASGLKTLTFKITLTCVAAGKDLNYNVQYLPKNSNTWTDSNIKTSTLNGTWRAWRNESSETITYSPTSSEPLYNARGIRVVSTTNFGKSWGKDVYRDVKITDVAFEKGTTFSVSSDVLEAFPATAINTTSTTTRSFTINYSNVENLSCSSDNSEFVVSSLSGDICTGSQTVVVSFTPNSACPTNRTATITVTAGSQSQTISVSGEALLMTPALDVNSDIQSVDLYSATFPDNKIDLSTLITTHTGGELVYAVTGATNGGDIHQAMLDGCVFYATHSGDYQVTVTSTEDCLYSSTAATLNIHVNDKVQPSFVLNGDETLEETYLNVETNTASIVLTNVDVSTLKMTYDHDILACQLENNVIVVTAKQIGEPTLTLEQPETPDTYNASRTFTFHITKNTATLTNNLVAEYLVDDEIAFTDLYTATNDEVAVIVLSSDETVLKADGDKLVAVGAGTAEITVSQAENYKWTALSETKTVTVNKHANTIVWSFAGVETTSKTLSYDEIVAVAYTSGNADTEGSPITIIQTAGEGIAAYNAEQHTITASYHNGTATWTVSQPEDRKFLAAEATITVTVAALQSGCDIINNSEEFDVPWNSTKGETTWNDINAAAQLTFEAKMQLWSTGDMEIEAYINGNWTKIQSIGTGSLSNDSYNTFSYELAAEVQGIRFKNAGTLSRYVKNVRISRRQHLTPSATKLTLPPIKLGNQDSVRFSLQWSTCADAIKLVSSNSYFKLNKTEIPTTGAGMADITLTYTSNEVETATSTITIYTPYQNITLEATGKTKKRDQKLSWTEPWKDIAEPAISIGREIKNPVESSVDGWIAAYTSSDPTVIDIEGVTLKALKAGTATITAYHPGNEEWASASTEKTFHVTGKRVQRIVWNQNLTKLNITDNTRELTAQVFTEDANGEFAFNADRTARLSYSSGNEEVVSVSDNMLTIHAVGETMLTAIVEGDDFYEEAQSSMPVRVRDNMAECPDYWVATDYNGEYEFFKLDIARPAIEKQYSIDRTTGIPDILTFQHRGSKWGPYYKGNIEVYESADGGGTWNKLETVSPKVGTEYQETSVALSHEATHIKFVRPQGGEGYHYIKNISIEPASFVESPSTVIDFGTMQVGSTEERTFIISYSGIKSSLAISIGDTENEESESSSNAVEPFVLSTTTIGECGKWGSEPIILSFTPNVSQVGELHSFVVVTEPVSKMSLRIPIEATITPNNHFTFTGGDTGSDEWGNGTNWSGKSIPTDDDEVIVAADVVITGDVSVAGLTINPDRTVKVQGKLTIGTEPSNDLSSYGNLIIENGGEVVLGEGKLQVNNFGICARLGGKSENADVPAQSGQIANVANLSVNGQAYFELALDASGQCSYGWYDFTVPFPVDAKDGVWRWENGTLRKLTYDTNYRIMDNHEDLHAKGQYDWKKFAGIMQQGACYTITVDDVHNVYRFYKSGNEPITVKISTALQVTEGDDTQKGWNGIGNGTLQYANLSMDGLDKVQIYDHAANKYNPIEAKDYSFAVGSSFFVQVKTNGTTMDYQPAATPRTLRASKVESVDDKEFVLQILGSDYVTDVLYLSASDTAANTYQIGHDLLKMGSPTDSRVACIWSVAYGHNLCDVELPLANNEATFELRMFAPVAGEYTLHMANQPANATLYLMQDGHIVHNLSLDDYTIALPKGVISDYSLWLQVQSKHITTDIESITPSANKLQKVLYQGHLYILHEGHTYTATGNMMR